MVMASAGVNMPGGDGNPVAVSPATPECRLRRRRRLAPPRMATVTAGPNEDPDAGLSKEKRIRPTSLSSSSSSQGSLERVHEEEEEEGEPRSLAPAEAPVAGLAPLPEAQPAAQVWPVAFGSMALYGRMREMEDTVSQHPSFCTWADGSPMHYFAVFDGHGGSLVSVLCQERMHVILAEELTREAAALVHRRQLRQQQAAAGAGTSAATGGSGSGRAWVEQEEEEEEHAWRAALSRSFRRVDELAALACACGRVSRLRCRCSLAGRPSGIVGSTAVVAVLVGSRLIVANCGDSRAVLCRGPAGSPPVPLSDDHKPDRPDEKARIEALGGQVIYINGPRVRGILAMSRALGDRFLRPEVICEPEITITQRTVEDECLILASDGMWDVITNETACSVARQCLEDGGAGRAAAAADLEDGGAGAAAAVGPYPEPLCNNAAGLLAMLAIGRGSLDNVSVVVIDLQRRG